jgi:hypothetical protein
MATEYVVLKRDGADGWKVAQEVIADTQEVACRLAAEAHDGGFFIAVPHRSWNVMEFKPEVQTTMKLVTKKAEAKVEQPPVTAPAEPPAE